jgi:hypothetical protein
MKSFTELRENNLTEALYDVSWGIGAEKQVVAKDAAEAIRKAKAEILKSKPKLADPKYSDTWQKNPSVHKIRESKINEETMELAGATFQNMEHCPGAVSAFKQNLKDGAKEEDVVKAAKAVDAYLAIEDKAKRSGATEADITKMKDLIGKAKSVISQLGLKGHMYHDMHLARVKKMMNEGIDLEESITRMSNARLKYHATKNFPHGSYTKAEIDDEHKRRMKTEPNYHTVKPSMNEQAEDDMPASPDEKSMAMKQAKFIEYVADEIEEYLEKNKPFPEWMQNKLSAFHEKAKDMHAVLAGDYDDEEDEMNEAAPKVKPDFIKMQRQKDAEHAKGVGVSVKTGRKLPTKTMTSTQRSLAQMRGNK